MRACDAITVATLDSATSGSKSERGASSKNGISTRVGLESTSAAWPR